MVSVRGAIGGLNKSPTAATPARWLTIEATFAL
jgi:hypothetical protein